jgi:hypothetical protein
MVKLEKKLDDSKVMKEWESKVSDLGLDFLTQQSVLNTAARVSMTEKEYDELQRDKKKVWLLLKECVEVPEAIKKKKAKRK